MKRLVVISYKGSLSITLYDEQGKLVKDSSESVESLIVKNASRVTISAGMEGTGITADYEGDVCFEKRGNLLEVRGCGARGGEE